MNDCGDHPPPECRSTLILFVNLEPYVFRISTRISILGPEVSGGSCKRVKSVTTDL